MGLRNVPTSIKDPNLAGLLRELRAAIVGVSDQVTKLVQTRSISSSGGGGGGGGTDPGTNPPVNPSPGGDGYPPPAPTSLTATADVWAINLAWENPVIADYLGTEIWAKRTFPTWSSATRYYVNAKVLYSGVVYRAKKGNDASGTAAVNNTNFTPSSSADWWEATTLTVMADRVKVAEVAGLAYTFTGLTSELLTPGETWAFWVRNHDTEDLYSTYFPADDDGVSATTLLDPGAMIDLLTGAIKDTQLYKDLGDRIDLIDAEDYITGSVNARLKAVQTDLDAQIGENGSAIIDLQETTADQATAITALGTRTTSAESSIINLQTTTAGQATSISTLGTRTTSAESKITNLQTTTASQAVSISSLTTRTSSAESNITNLQTTTANQATSISNLTSTVSGHTTSISTQATSIDGLKAQFTVKIDNNGWVSGIGLASTPVNGVPFSDFIVRVDRFSIAQPSSPDAGYQSDATIPFIVTTSSSTINGETVPAGTYIKDAYIQNGTITTAKIGDAQIVNAKIGSFIASTSYNGSTTDPASNPGTLGWCVSKNGNAAFNTVIVRSGANVGANALRWSKFYGEFAQWQGTYAIYGNSFTKPRDTGVPSTNSGTHILCYTRDDAANYLTIPQAPGRAMKVVCTITMEPPSKARQVTINGAAVTVLNTGSTEGVWLALAGRNPTLYGDTNTHEIAQKEVFFMDGKDIHSHCFTSCVAFSYYYGQLDGWSNFHIVIKVRHSSGSLSNTYSNLRMNVDAYVE